MSIQKHFAHTRKKTMSVTDFEIWSQNAEQLRDDALKRHAAGTEDEQKEIVETLRTELNQMWKGIRLNFGQ